jgi:FkbM family methyltransferase
MIKRYFPKTPLVAFDPVCRPTFDISDIEFYNVALADFSGTAEVHVPRFMDNRLTQYSSLNSTKVISQIVNDFGVSDSKIYFESKSVKVMTLDSLGLLPFFVKIDVEGSELSVLQGARETLSKFHPIILIEIQNQETYQSIAKLLGEFGYRHISLELELNLNSIFFSRNFESGYNTKSNNYIWISYPNTLSWRFKD